VERGSIKLDLHRRDFTINTMAMRLNGRHHGELYDFWGGLTDLRQKRIRVLHSLSFVDDPTRMLRAARFEQRFHFHIETRTLDLIREASDLLRQVSGDRIRHEFNLIFQEADPPAVFRRLEELCLLEAILPGLRWGKDQNKAWSNLINNGSFQDSGTIPSEMYWLVLFHNFDPSKLDTASQRFKLSQGICGVLEAASKLGTSLHELQRLPVVDAVKFLDAFPENALRGASIFEPELPASVIIQKYLAEWRHIQPTINGRHLEKMGIPRGPLYRTIFDTLRAAWLTGKVTSPAEEEALLKELIFQEEHKQED
jgi:tRNA nucleotidyltransferase (CCA-adding enzyme)